MVEYNSIKCNSIESIEQNSIDTYNQQFRLNKISKLEDYFIAEIKERELMIKTLSKCISFFGYFDKSLFVLSVTSGGISIASLAAVIGVPIGITNASFSLAVSLCTGLVKKLLKASKNRKRNIIKLLF